MNIHEAWPQNLIDEERNKAYNSGWADATDGNESISHFVLNGFDYYYTMGYEDAKGEVQDFFEDWWLNR
jgi:hypothetical protein